MRLTGHQTRTTRIFDNTDSWAAGATHIPVPNGEEQEISIPWFRWKLLGDQAACKYFKAIPMKDMRWNEVAVKNAQDCK